MGQRGEEGEHSYLGFVKRIFMECRDEGSFWIDYSPVIAYHTSCDWDEGTLKIVARKMLTFGGRYFSSGFCLDKFLSRERERENERGTGR